MTTVDGAFERFELLVGTRAAGRIARSHVAVVGLGGVGGQAAEALVRCGVGEMTLVDGDAVQPSNLNRQIVAETVTIGRLKAEVMAGRAARVNPGIRAHAVARFITPDNVEEILPGPYDYLVDAIDDMAAKVALIAHCHERGIPVVSSAGMARRLDPAQLRVMDLFETRYDPMARRMRGELRKRGITRLDVACSLEPPLPANRDPADRRANGSAVFVTASAGLLLAAHVVRALLREGGRADAR